MGSRCVIWGVWCGLSCAQCWARGAGGRRLRGAHGHWWGEELQRVLLFPSGSVPAATLPALPAAAASPAAGTLSRPELPGPSGPSGRFLAELSLRILPGAHRDVAPAPGLAPQWGVLGPPRTGPDRARPSMRTLPPPALLDPRRPGTSQEHGVGTDEQSGTRDGAQDIWGYSWAWIVEAVCRPGRNPTGL